MILLNDFSQITIALIGGVVGILGVLILGLKSAFAAYFTRLTNKISHEVPDAKRHPLFQAIKNRKLSVDYTTFSVNVFKNAVLKEREKLFWGLIEEVCHLLLEGKDEAVDKIHQMPDVLKNNDFPPKTIEVLEGCTFYIKQFLVDLLSGVLADDKLFPTRNQKLHASFTLLLEYMKSAHNTAILLLKHANGKLKNEEFRGICNDGTMELIDSSRETKGLN